MKKKLLFLLALSAMVIGGCTKSEIDEASINTSNAITFATSTDKLTKAPVLDNDFEDGEAFGVYAYYTGQDTWEDYTGKDNPNFMNNQKVEYNSSAWSYTPMKYWPNSSGEMITFFAYMPYVDGKTTASIENGSLPKIVFNQNMNAETMLDLTVAKVIDQEKTTSAVVLPFEHVTTRLNFSAKVDHDLIEDDNYSYNTTVFVKGLRLLGTDVNDNVETLTDKVDANAASKLYSKATYTLSDVNGTNGSWDYNEANLTQRSKAIELKNILDLATQSAPSDYSESAIAIDQTGDETALLQTGEYLFLIPPSAEGVTASTDVVVQIDYDIVTADAGVGGYAKTSTTATISMPTGSLLEGVAYNVIISIGVDEVELIPDPTTWDLTETDVITSGATVSDADDIVTAIKNAFANGDDSFRITYEGDEETLDLDLSEVDDNLDMDLAIYLTKQSYDVAIEMPAEYTGQLTVYAPSATVTLNGTTTFTNLVVATALNTLIISQGVTVDGLTINAGNVTVYGTLMGDIYAGEDLGNNASVISYAGEEPEATIIDEDKISYSDSPIDIRFSNDTYYIYTDLGLQAFANLVNGGGEAPSAVYSGFDSSAFSGEAQASINGTLMANIDLSEICHEDNETTDSEVSWTPTGNYSNNSLQYNGTFDGNGYEVQNLYINTENNYQGLFGYISGATIKNLGVVDGSITSSGSNVGGIVGCAYNYYTIINCYTTGGSVEGASYVGGITGYHKGDTITNCYNTNSVKGSSTYVGGIVGDASSATIASCYSAGKVDGGGTYKGGVVGRNYNSTISYCYYDKSDNVIGTSNAPGTAVGISSSSTGTADTDYIKGLETTDMQDEAFVTLLNNRVFYYNMASPAVEAYAWKQNAGGYPTFDYDSTPESSTFDLTYDSKSDSYLISSAADLKTFADAVNGGWLTINGTLTKSIDLSSVCGDSVGDSGEVSWTPISNTTSYTYAYKGTFNGGGYEISGLYIKSESDYQGLFGYTYGATIKNLGVVDGSITSTGNNVGGIVGCAHTHSSIINCYNTCSISSNSYSVGGIVGAIYTTCYMINCYNEGSVEGSINIGGIVGFAQSVTIASCYSAGKVDGGGTYKGGVVGRNYSSTISYCYYDKSDNVIGTSNAPDTAVGSSSSSNGTADTGNLKGLSTNEMQSADFVTLLDYGADLYNQTTPTVEACAWKKDEGNYYPTLDYDGTPVGYAINLEYVANIDMYKISSAADLKEFATAVNYGYNDINGILTTDIDLSTVCDSDSNTSWTPIGSSTYKYSGNFDGNGYEVQNLYINTENNYQGLFGYISGATIKNLGVVDGSITSSGNYVGGIVGYSTSPIINCYTDGGSVEGASYVGGIVGYSYKTIGCYNTGSVMGSNYVGGIAGYGSTIISCYSVGSVSCSDTIKGGVVGCRNFNSTSAVINYCFYNTDEIGDSNNPSVAAYGISSHNSVTGLITNKLQNADFVTQLNYGAYSYNHTNPTVEACAWQYNEGGYPTFDYNSAPEGPTFDLTYDSKSDSYLINDAEDLQSFAALVNVGYTAFNITLTNNIDLSTICGEGGDSWAPIGNYSIKYSGTFDGNGYEVKNLYINSDYDYQGLFGYVSDGEIKNLGIVNCNITSSGSNVGGLVGRYDPTSSSFSISNCYNTGGSVTGTSSVGGITGWFTAFLVFNTMSDCYNTSSVKGSDQNIGGITGVQTSSADITISNCYNMGSVEGGSRVGGITGYAYTDYGAINITSCYNNGSVTGSSDVGGVLGEGNADAFSKGITVTYSYYNSNIVTTDNNSYGIGLSTELMKASDSTVGSLLYLFNTGGYSEYWVEDTDSSINDGYPILSWQIED